MKKNIIYIWALARFYFILIPALKGGAMHGGNEFEEKFKTILFASPLIIYK